MFGAGAAGFFALPYAALMYPVLFMAFPRLWSVSNEHGDIIAADFVRGRFGHRGLALAIAVTGLVAVLPYMALQLVGMQVVIAALGLDWNVALPVLGTVSVPLILSFIALAAFTYTSGLRGTALIAVVKDLLVYITVLAAIIIIPTELGGYGKIFAAVPAKQVLLAPTPKEVWARALPMSPWRWDRSGAVPLSPFGDRASVIVQPPCHSQECDDLARLSGGAGLHRPAWLHGAGRGREDNAGICPGLQKLRQQFRSARAVPHAFPGWFAGLAFAAIAIGALMPASIMAIACGNLFTRNIFKEFIAPDCSPHTEARMAKLVAFVAKLGALFFVLELQTTYAIQLQLLGGIWICQTVPAVLLALYVRLDPRALLAGWAVGVGLGSWMVMELGFKSSTYPLHILGETIPCYAAVSALVANLLVSWLLTLVLRAAGRVQIIDQTARRLC